MAASPVAVGERFARRAVFDAASIRRFAAMSDDENPLHRDDAAAAAGPFGRLIASGPHVSSLMMGLDATYLSRRFDALGLEFDFRFVKAITRRIVGSSTSAVAVDGFSMTQQSRSVAVSSANGPRVSV